VAVCPGAGGTLFADLPRGPKGPDLLLTGEMRHHDVLDRVASGTSVVLTDHTNCERGWLPILRSALLARLGNSVSVALSTVDRDPLRIV
jgi:putative NIF3 family GTP cyclohydrolase 1 type 2